MQSPHIALLCATARGEACLRKIAALLPHARLTVFSFREEPWEPPFFKGIREFSEQASFAFHEAKSLAAAQGAAGWRTSPPDLLLAVNWRYLVPREIFSLPRMGAFVFHDSLLPAYRGFSPTVWAMINGQSQTGATLLEMADGVDAGGIVDQAAVPIGEDDCIGTVVQRVTDSYLELLERNLTGLLAGFACPKAQDSRLATFCCKRLPEDNRIDWKMPAEQIHNLIRATTRPYPGAFTSLSGRQLKVWSARRVEVVKSYVGAVPGRVVEIIPGEGVLVLTGTSPLLLCEVQLGSETPTLADTTLNKLAHTLC